MDVETAIKEAMNVMGLRELKEKQKEATMMFVQGHDTFVMIPNGYGKSIIYSFLLLVFDKLKGMKTLLSFFTMLGIMRLVDTTICSKANNACLIY